MFQENYYSGNTFMYEPQEYVSMLIPCKLQMAEFSIHSQFIKKKPKIFDETTVNIQRSQSCKIGF